MLRVVRAGIAANPSPIATNDKNCRLPRDRNTVLIDDHRSEVICSNQSLRLASLILGDKIRLIK